MCFLLSVVLFFFKQKTAYELRISDWSSDVCSSDLPRQVLRRNLDKARERGFSFYAAPELEFFYFADADTTKGPPVPLDHASYFDLTTADVASDLRSDARRVGKEWVSRCSTRWATYT